MVLLVVNCWLSKVGCYDFLNIHYLLRVIGIDKMDHFLHRGLNIWESNQVILERERE